MGVTEGQRGRRGWRGAGEGNVTGQLPPPSAPRVLSRFPAFSVSPREGDVCFRVNACLGATGVPVASAARPGLVK